jgi:hypothetical protein
VPTERQEKPGEKRKGLCGEKQTTNSTRPERVVERIAKEKARGRREGKGGGGRKKKRDVEVEF